MDVRAAVIAKNCFDAAMFDVTWQAFGFKRRPPVGPIRNLFKPSWRRTLERRVLREMLVAYTAAHLRAYSDDAIRENLRADLFSFYIGDDGRFELNIGRIGEFGADVDRYMNANEQECFALLTDHLGIPNVPDRNMSARLLWGAAQFPLQLGNITLLVREFGSDMSNWPKPAAQGE